MNYIIGFMTLFILSFHKLIITKYIQKYICFFVSIICNVGVSSSLLLLPVNVISLEFNSPSAI